MYENILDELYDKLDLIHKQIYESGEMIDVAQKELDDFKRYISSIREIK